MSVNFTEGNRLRLLACDREIRRARVRLDRERVNELLHEAQHATVQGHPSTVWKIALQIGARYHGARRRRFNPIPTYTPALEDWQDTMESSAAEGSFSASRVLGPGSPSAAARGQRDLGDPDEEWKDMRGRSGTAAYDDWTNTPALPGKSCAAKIRAPRSVPGQPRVNPEETLLRTTAKHDDEYMSPVRGWRRGPLESRSRSDTPVARPISGTGHARFS
eukprot:1038508-Pyramimonas_sp.AAC.1